MTLSESGSLCLGVDPTIDFMKSFLQFPQLKHPPEGICGGWYNTMSGPILGNDSKGPMVSNMY